MSFDYFRDRVSYPTIFESILNIYLDATITTHVEGVRNVVTL